MNKTIIIILIISVISIVIAISLPIYSLTQKATNIAKVTAAIKQLTIPKKSELDFYKDLAKRESAHNNNVINRYGYIGLFQMGETALKDAGYYKGDNTRANDWVGKWSGKDGIKTKDQFLHAALIQLQAIRDYHALIWHEYLKDYQRYIGKKIGDITLTKSGMIAAAHLVGAGSVKEFIRSNGSKIAKDANNVPCTSYMLQFSNYDLDHL